MKYFTCNRGRLLLGQCVYNCNRLEVYTTVIVKEMLTSDKISQSAASRLDYEILTKTVVKCFHLLIWGKIKGLLYSAKYCLRIALDSATVICYARWSKSKNCYRKCAIMQIRIWAAG